MLPRNEPLILVFYKFRPWKSFCISFRAWVVVIFLSMYHLFSDQCPKHAHASSVRVSTVFSATLYPQGNWERWPNVSGRMELLQFWENIIDYDEDRVCIYNYWKSNQFKLLKEIAQKFLAPPPSSIESNRVFSTLGNIYTDKCNCLSSNHAHMQLFFS